MPSTGSVQVRSDRLAWSRSSRRRSSSAEPRWARARPALSWTVRRESVSAPASRSASAPGFSFTAPEISRAFLGESFPPRRASSTPGWEPRFSPSFRVSRASPSDSPVSAASHSAPERWPERRWMSESAARLAARVLPAWARCSIRAKRRTREAASSPLKRAGSKDRTNPSSSDSTPDRTEVAPSPPHAAEHPAGVAPPVALASVFVAPPGTRPVMGKLSQGGVTPPAGRIADPGGTAGWNRPGEDTGRGEPAEENRPGEDIDERGHRPGTTPDGGSRPVRTGPTGGGPGLGAQETRHPTADRHPLTATLDPEQ